MSNASRTAGSLDETIATSAPSNASPGSRASSRPRWGSFDSTWRRLAPTRRAGLTIRSIDADLEALAEQSLGQLHVWALTQVIRVHLEAQTEQGDSMAVARDDPVHHFADHQLVGSQRSSEQRQVRTVHAARCSRDLRSLGRQDPPKAKPGCR